MEHQETKVCSDCKKDKPIEDFYIISGNKRRKNCFVCYNRKCTHYQNMRKQIDPAFKLLKTLRGRVKSAIKTGKKSASTVKLLGCSLEFAKSHIESQFHQGMTWDNHGFWHIDHIKPCAAFDLNNPEEQQKCFHYSNLQPLWADENLSKSDKYSI